MKSTGAVISYIIVFLMGCVFVPDIKNALKEKPKFKELKVIEYDRVDFDNLFHNKELNHKIDSIDSDRAIIQKHIMWLNNVIPNAN